MESGLETLGAVLVLAGGIITIIGAIGLVRLGNVFARIHAAGVIDTGGVALMLLGMLCLAPGWLIAAKLVIIGIFLFFTSPISGHAIAQAAWENGVHPGKQKSKSRKRRRA